MSMFQKTGAFPDPADPPRVAVSGSAGGIGSSLVPLLEAHGCEVVELPDESSAASLPPDLRCDVFVNLAWRGSRGPLRADCSLQIDMVRRSIDYYALARRMGCRRFICPGTIGELMVETPGCGGLRSENSVYVSAKCFLHRVLLAKEDPECKVVWARLGNIYGPGDTGNLVGWTLERILKGEKAAFGPALQPYEFVAKDDCARALAALVEAPELSRDSYYIGVGEPRELGSLLREIGRLAGREELVAIGMRPDDGTRYRAEWFDISPLTADTGFRPAVGFSDGVLALIERIGRKGEGA